MAGSDTILMSYSFLNPTSKSLRDMAGINMRSVQRWMSRLESPVVLRAKVAFPCFVLLCNSCLCSGLGFSPFPRKSLLLNVYEVTASLSDIIVPLIFNNLGVISSIVSCHILIFQVVAQHHQNQILRKLKAISALSLFKT